MRRLAQEAIAQTYYPDAPAKVHEPLAWKDRRLRFLWRERNVDLCGLTFELSRHRRETAGPARLRIDRTDSTARQFAVGARFQRMVRPGVEKQA